MTMIGLRYDLRAPSFCSVTHAELYAACLEQCAWADRLGLDFVVLSEHHGVDDGYLPAPLTLAAAIAGRTKSIRINVAAVLVPLHDPVRLAEQLAVLDLASGSRVGLIAGLGYRHEEFAMAGVDRAERGRLLEEYLAVMRQAWTGEPFRWRGRTVRVTPKPASPPIGGSTEKAACGASRWRLLPRDRRPAPGPGLPGGVPAPRLRRRLRSPPERAELRPRERRPRARLGAHRAARALRRADLRVVADARPALVDARGGEERRPPPAKRRLPRGDARGVRGARAGDGAGAPPPAHGRAPARARLGRARALRGAGAAAPAPRLSGAGSRIGADRLHAPRHGPLGVRLPSAVAAAASPGWGTS